MAKKYYSSGELIAVVRALDYKGQYKVCYDFYDEIIMHPQFDENKHCLKFDEILNGLTKKKMIQQCVEVMLDALRDIGHFEPATFQKIVAKIIQM